MHVVSHFCGDQFKIMITRPALHYLGEGHRRLIDGRDVLAVRSVNHDPGLVGENRKLAIHDELEKVTTLDKGKEGHFPVPVRDREPRLSRRVDFEPDPTGLDARKVQSALCGNDIPLRKIKQPLHNHTPLHRKRADIAPNVDRHGTGTNPRPKPV